MYLFFFHEKRIVSCHSYKEKRLESTSAMRTFINNHEVDINTLLRDKAITLKKICQELMWNIILNCTFFPLLFFTTIHPLEEGSTRTNYKLELLFLEFGWMANLFSSSKFSYS
jgi:hypothetical protein